MHRPPQTFEMFERCIRNALHSCVLASSPSSHVSVALSVPSASAASSAGGGKSSQDAAYCVQDPATASSGDLSPLDRLEKGNIGSTSVAALCLQLIHVLERRLFAAGEGVHAFQSPPDRARIFFRTNMKVGIR